MDARFIFPFAHNTVQPVISNCQGVCIKNYCLTLVLFEVSLISSAPLSFVLFRYIHFP